MRCSVLPDETSRSSSCLASRVTANAALLAHMLGSLTRATRIVLAPYPSEEMICWPVSPRVGNVRNNDADLIEPLAAVTAH
jgi:hypothetical protein